MGILSSARLSVVIRCSSGSGGFVHCAQFGLENLAVAVLWQRIDEDVILWPLEAGDRIEAELVELAGRRIADHIGNHDLAPFAIRAPDDRDLTHARMLEEHLLDLAW